MLNMPLEADHRAARAVMERIFPGDFVNKSSTTRTTAALSICGIKETKSDNKSALETEGII